MINQFTFKYSVASLILVLLGACGGQDVSNISAKVNADTASSVSSNTPQTVATNQSTAASKEASLNAQISGGEIAIKNFIGVFEARIRLPVYKGKLPDTGVTTSHCFGMGSNTLISCTSPEAITLNPDQDGMVGRDVIVPTGTDGKLGFSYSALPNQAGGVYDKTDCVKDNITGLIWEGKPETGFRANTNTYTNFDSTTKLQKYVSNDIGYFYVAPTQAEIDASNNSIGYKTAVNTSNLCGFNDWRLPTAEELHGLVDYSASPLPAIDNDWFLNSLPNEYWTGSQSVGQARNAWTVNFWGGTLNYSRSAEAPFGDRHVFYPVRLVRGTNVAIPNRYSYQNSGSEVFDGQTNLIWRRCVEGMMWDGLTCTGSAGVYTREQVSLQAKSQLGWRLPNVKELSSIVERSVVNPAVSLEVFPATPFNNFWSSTPFIPAPLTPVEYTFPGAAWYINFTFGYANQAPPTYQIPIRLVKDGS